MICIQSKNILTDEIRLNTLKIGGFKMTIFNPLSPSIHVQILQTDLHTFP